MPYYAESAEWADIDPLPQNDGPGSPLAAIMYPEAYSEAMSYLRAIIAKQETTERVLRLTEDIISMNAAHYTVWHVTRQRTSSAQLTTTQALPRKDRLRNQPRPPRRNRLAQPHRPQISQELPDMAPPTDNHREARQCGRRGGLSGQDVRYGLEELPRMELQAMACPALRAVG